MELMSDSIALQYMMNVMKRMGINSVVTKVIGDFLTARSGYVSFNGCNSMIFDIRIGCVQGSVLGPRLFNMYMSDLESSLPPDVFFTSYP